ncbi:ABC transporter ATP-binding protein [Halanaerobiaceae bacterium Z-7014]|uniref:ABC transporter ATP-binding protein n=1 Tax=Halonatronomonas betaini TaxID=2778430 RepID=A0A931AVQ3_9FIRM|nr:ABC transporter ATP-binding protein [Halonatronomonas betaini]MBF8435668.1 ABC transporter ATP-binding protein [Halonatronomonas betaini]
MLIKVEDLKKSFGKRTALKGISFELEAGQIYGLLGPNGAGKTTTIKILTGQLRADSGQALLFGEKVFGRQEEVLSNVGIVPEDANLYERLTIEQNLNFFKRLYQCSGELIDFYLEKVSLLGEKKTKVKDLSKGMKQKVLLVRALIHRPEILILDEPTSGLDPASADSLHNILLELKEEGITILLTSHNMEEVDKLCDRVGFLNQGELVASGRPFDLKLNYSENRVRVLYYYQKSSEQNLIEKTMQLDDPEAGEFIADLIKSGRMKSIHSLEPTLADIFVKLTGRNLEDDGS